ncbi:MAG: PilZ domain-containing protein [Pseudomonadota bacterium]
MKDATATATRPNPAGRRSVYLTRPAEMTMVLRILRDHAADLELRLPGVQREYTARILDVERRAFLIEDIRPRDGLLRLRHDTRFTFAASVDGLYLCGEDCTITAVESERGLPYFRASLPQRLLRQQRRRHTRIAVPPRVSPDEGAISLYRATVPHTPLCGQILDVSVGGCRAVFDGAVVPALDGDEILPRCELTLTRSFSLATEAVIRHSGWDAKQRLTTCGIEFTDMGIADRRRLEQYVQQLAGRGAKR